MTIALVQYVRDQRRQRNLRIEERVAENLTILTCFSADATTPLAAPIASLYALKVLVKLSTVQKTYQDQITYVIAASIREDLDFTVTNHIRFDQLCLSEWEPYAASEAELPKDNMFIITRYLAAFKVVVGNSPGLVRHIKIVDQKLVGVPQGTQYEDLRHLIYLVEAYSVRVSLLPDNLQQQADQRFRQSTGNDALVQYIQQQRTGHVTPLLELLAN